MWEHVLASGVPLIYVRDLYAACYHPSPRDCRGISVSPGSPQKSENSPSTLDSGRDLVERAAYIHYRGKA
eukprot:scaffold61540_cov65-Phaeocystis_antarctica.AAC.2